MKITLAAALTLALAATGCSALAEDGGGGGGSSEVRVAAAFYPLAWVAEQVGGDYVAVDSLVGAGGSDPHDLELSIDATATLADADLVIHAAGFQPAVDDGVAQNAGGEVVDAAAVVGLLPTEDEHDEDHGDDHAEDHHEHDGHDHGDLDPHFWLDPLRMATLGDEVGDRLAELDPDHADEHLAAAERLRAELERLDEEYAEGLADCERDTVVVSHDAFGYLERHGLHFAAVAGLSPDAEPTPADLAELQELIAEEGITTVFSERLAPQRLTDQLAADLGLATAVLDPLEGLTEETADEDYLSLMRANLARLQEANGCR